MAKSRLTTRTDPAALVAIILAAAPGRRPRGSGAAAKRELRETHGIVLSFRRPAKREGDTDAA